MISSKVIIALDFSERQQVLDLVSGLDPQECRLKVGKELFTSYGPQIVRELQALGFEIFLDLKFHDIPNTVYKAIRAAADLGVWMVNVHASGGRAMLTQARQAINDSQNKPLLIAVTILTSLSVSEVAEIGYGQDLASLVKHLAGLSYECGLDGVVCSAQEANIIKSVTAPGFLTVTPGIRLADATKDDQTRVMTPDAAVKNGADYLVIGRPIAQAQDPLAILHKVNSLLNK
ncbi:MAG: orotidine-5'-phosphate decarboxylase [Burkholderiales bacterium]|jgi:orotidine-5'-phosphate decarboxylase|nr:orotidine-5'-phosphate decarboxylase [Burkholderiales bacterium]